ILGAAGESEGGMDELTVGIAALARTPLFAGLDRDDLHSILGCGQRVWFEPGQAIVERGLRGDAMYIIVAGAAGGDVGGGVFRGGGCVFSAGRGGCCPASGARRP